MTRAARRTTVGPPLGRVMGPSVAAGRAGVVGSLAFAVALGPVLRAVVVGAVLVIALHLRHVELLVEAHVDLASAWLGDLDFVGALLVAGPRSG